MKFESFRRTNCGELLDMSSEDVQPARYHKNIISNMNCEFSDIYETWMEDPETLLARIFAASHVVWEIFGVFGRECQVPFELQDVNFIYGTNAGHLYREQYLNRSLH
ncbi:hypothetical protein ANN_18517 [Periplaneta americana]|uniref:Uncharacterized protein n=1 Tax=Periplaneta americana TaxID=6978 RepID=A0ABQ8SNZ3_PERAM|nr:hypothetical protein ANN_18517 [Periplaneta americana]